jgi:hypothetical protein
MFLGSTSLNLNRSSVCDGFTRGVLGSRRANAALVRHVTLNWGNLVSEQP